MRKMRVMLPHTNRRTIARLALAAALVTLGQFAIAQSAIAQSINSLGQFKKWAAYTAVENGNKICFMYANPASEGDEKPTAFFYVTQRPGENLRNDVSYISGYVFQSDSLANAVIGGETFSFFTKQDGAWIEDAEQSELFVSAMRRGNTMVLNGTDVRGVKIQHSFSLSGATAGSRAIIGACP